MYPPRQHFALLKPITKKEWNELPSYLSNLFSEPELVKQRLMLPHETLQFDTNLVERDGGLWAFFTVAVSDCSPTDALLAALVAGFEQSAHERYVIGKPGSGFGPQPGGTKIPS